MLRSILIGLSCFLPALVLRAEVNQFWIYKSTNLLVPEQTEQTIQLLQRAAKAGYTHCLITDSKFSRLDDLPQRYFENAAKVRKAAADAHIELVPAVFPVGYSNDLLHADPNLIEGLPVRDCEMVVTNHAAQVIKDPALVIKGGDFTHGQKGWSWKDETITFENGTATSRDPNGKNSRISQTIKLKPWRQYHISVRVRSNDYKGTPEVKVIGKNGRILNWDYLKVAPTQDWKLHHVVFNSQEMSEATLYLGCWDGKTGEMQWDDATIEECPFVNLIRRSQAPLRVKTADGRELKEGVDFQPLSDPLLGTKPYAGCYTVWHEPPVLKTELPEGTKLLISYFHGVTVHDDQAGICVSEPKTLELLKDQAKRVHALWGAKGYFMSHDEIRVFNWGERAKKQDAGELLAENASACVKILRELNPGGKIYVWGDMFDPNHNARNNYYLVNGDLKGSWEGLDKDVIMVPWAFELRDKSMAFHSERGHRQIMAGFYDGPPAPNAKGWMQSAKQFTGVEGIMYTTWVNDYSKLEEFIRAAKGN